MCCLLPNSDMPNAMSAVSANHRSALLAFCYPLPIARVPLSWHSGFHPGGSSRNSGSQTRYSPVTMATERLRGSLCERGCRQAPSRLACKHASPEKARSAGMNRGFFTGQPRSGIEAHIALGIRRLNPRGSTYRPPVGGSRSGERRRPSRRRRGTPASSFGCSDSANLHVLHQPQGGLTRSGPGRDGQGSMPSFFPSPTVMASEARRPRR